MSMKQHLPCEETVSHFWQINETLHITGTCITNMHGSPDSREPWLPSPRRKYRVLSSSDRFLFPPLSGIFSDSMYVFYLHQKLINLTKIEAPTCLLMTRAWHLSMGSRKTASPLLFFSSLSPSRLKVGWGHGCFHFFWDSSYHNSLVIPSGSCHSVPASTPCTQAGA